jgi:hypothetical protein
MKISTKKGNITTAELSPPNVPLVPLNIVRHKNSDMALKEMKEEIVDMTEKLRIKNLPQILQMR